MTPGDTVRVRDGFRAGQTGIVTAITNGKAHLRLTSTGEPIALDVARVEPVDTSRPVSAAGARAWMRAREREAAR